MNKRIKSNLVILCCFFFVGVLYGGGESSQGGKEKTKYREEGWRLCEDCEIIFQPTVMSEPYNFNFMEEHRTLETLVKQLPPQDPDRNNAMVSFSLVVEHGKVDKVFLVNFPTVLRRVRKDDGQRANANLLLVFKSGAHGESCGEFKEGTTPYCIMKSPEISREGLEKELSDRLGKNLEGSFLEHSEAHREINADLTTIKRLANLGTVNLGAIDKPSELKPARECIDVFEQLQHSYLDSEQQLIRTLHNPVFQEQFCKRHDELKEREKFNRVLGIVMHLYTQRSPCNKCASALFREGERIDGLAKKYQRLIAALQDQYLPFFSLMVSCSQYHQRVPTPESGAIPSLFYGIERPLLRGQTLGPRRDSIDPKKFAPFYLLVLLDKIIESGAAAAGGGAEGDTHGGPANQPISEKQKLLQEFEQSRFEFCVAPEELNRRKLLQFCDEHGGIGTWMDVIMPQDRLAVL